jgi:UDP-N-acetyl-D-galactosamine dehydrogenase
VKIKQGQPIICVVGLGYVGLPLAEAFSQHFEVIGFDTNSNRVKELRLKNNNQNLIITHDPQYIKRADFVIITVPTPVTKSKEPDLSYIVGAAKTISRNMKAGCTVILESTVYPGVTEDVVKPILKESGLQCGQDFKIAYSPERINPGDEEHALDKISKVVAGMNSETTEITAKLYSRICRQVFKAKDIKTAEAAKVIENIQRDLNIALINELCLIFDRMGLKTKDVLDSAATKWNFHRYLPGLVGGHCIPVDPYYLVYKAKELGYHPQVILAGRAINDYMPRHIVQMAIKGLNEVGKVIKGSRVLIMGLTYKENVADTRETPAKDIIKELKEYGVEITGFDPLLLNNSIEQEFGIRAVVDLEKAKDIDCLILAVVHDDFRELTLDKLRGIMSDTPLLIDVRGFFDEEEVERKGFHYNCL